jgi:GntR family transcriptional repressor for pyruvate dehydrogenase complex
MPIAISNSKDGLSDSRLAYWILTSLKSDGQPLGAGSLSYLLRKSGSNLSAPTIGRKLRDLEERGLLEKVGVDGRILTGEGQQVLVRLEREYRIETSGEKFLELLKRNSRKDIIDQLVARRTIEGETASLAATAISTKGIAHLEAIIEQQRELVSTGEPGIDEDLKFHVGIGEGSGNSVLAAMVRLLRSDGWINHVIVAIRAKVGTRFVVDHEEILKAIRSRRPNQAREAMESHIHRLISDVDRYWEQVFPNG